MENKRSIEYYESHMWDVKLEDITSDKDNAEILRKLRDNDPDFTSITLNDSLEEHDDFVISDDDDLGWLGYFIGRNSQLKYFYICTWLDPSIDLSQIDALTQGISLNRSISTLEIHLDNELFLQRLDDFFRSNKSLIHLELGHSVFELETARNLAVVLNDMSLETFRIEGLCYDSDSDTFIDDGTVTAEVITALGKHKKLESLTLWSCNLDRSGCMALGRLPSLKELKLYNCNVDAKGVMALTEDMLRCLESLEIYGISIDNGKAMALPPELASLHSLKKLKLRNSIDDDALQRVVAAIANNTAVEVLDLSQNTSITAKGLSSLSSLLQSEKCCLRQLFLHDMHIGDEGAEILAEALVGNKSLKCLEFCDLYYRSARERTGITGTGWSAFTRLLCDTSSINKTYLSNHTLERCDTAYAARTAFPEFDYYLSVNKNQQYAAMYKILKNYPDFDMKPLLLWQLKFLPLMVAWFKVSRTRWRSWHCWWGTWGESISSLQRRELSATYQFVRGLPLLTVAGWRKQKMTGNDSKKRKFDGL